MSTCCVLGLGYIGLPTAAVLAKSNHVVIGVDIDQAVVDTVNAGSIHIVEPGLEHLVSSVVQSGKLKAQLSPTSADIYIVAVPTPFSASVSGIPQPNTDYVLKLFFQ